jgi:hypothetical protein
VGNSLSEDRGGWEAGITMYLGEIGYEECGWMTVVLVSCPVTTCAVHCVKPSVSAATLALLL